MIEVSKKNIGGLSLELSQLPAFSALPAFHRFLAYIGPAVPALAVTLKQLKGKKLAALTPEVAVPLLAGLLEALPSVLVKSPPEETVELAKLLLAPCIVVMGDGRRARLLEVADEVLTGKLKAMLEIIGWAVQVHFGGFFDELGAAAARAPVPPAA